MVGTNGVVPGWLGVLAIEAPSSMQGDELRLRMPEERVGRHGSVVLRSVTVSREHARFWTERGRTFIDDLGSANGTYVNGHPVTKRQILRDGDRIRLGEVEAVFRLTRPPRGRRPPPSPRVTARSDTTRYLCAATHLDPRYREWVLDATIRDKHRAVCPPYGVDLAVVVRHAIGARDRALIRDVVLSGLLIIGLAAIVGGAISDDVAGALRRGRWDQLAAAGWSALGVGLFLLGIAWIILALATWQTLTTLGVYLRPGGRPDEYPGGMSSGAVRQLRELSATDRGNVVVYSGFRPFVGSGLVVGQGSYTVPLLSAHSNTDVGGPVEFGAGELVAAVIAELEQLGLDDLHLERLLYVDGFDVGRFPELLPNPRTRPAVAASARMVADLTEFPCGAARPYLCARTTAWQGQLVVSIFIRIVVLNGVIFIETATLVLPPLRSPYFAVDTMRIRRVGERLVATIGMTTSSLLPRLFGALPRLRSALRAQSASVRRNKEVDHRIDDRVLVDRGARSSIREEACRDDFTRYFMQLDAEMAISVVEQRVADTIAEFLDERGFSTDKIHLIQNNIDNSVRISNNSGQIGAAGQNAQGSASSAQTPAAGARRR
jgi:hypothetical protein